MFTGSRTGLPAYIRSVVTRCERSASCAATIPKTPTYSFPSAAGQSVLLASTASPSASARLPRCHFRSTPTCFAMPVGSSSLTMATTRGPCSITSGTRTSSTRCATPKWRPIASGTFGVDRCRRRQARHRFPLYHLGICLGLTLRQHLHDKLDTALNLLGRHRLDPAGMLQLHLPGHQHCADLQIRRRRLAPHPLEHVAPMLLPVLRQIEQKALVERSARGFRAAARVSREPRREPAVDAAIDGLGSGVWLSVRVHRLRLVLRDDVYLILGELQPSPCWALAQAGGSSNLFAMRAACAPVRVAV